MTNITPILETYGQQLQTVQTFQTSSNTLDTDSQSIYFPDTLQPLAQTIPHHNEFQPMSSQQKAAMAHTALINFFGDSGTISSILQMVQPTQPQTLTEQSHQLTNDLQVMVSDNQQGTSLQTSTQHQSTYNNSQNIPYTIPHIHHIQEEHLQIPMLHHLPQLHNKPITDKATEYHIITLTLILILIEEE